MNTKEKTGIRIIFYLGGLLFMTLGVAISVKSGLGVTPISSIPYTMTVVTGMDLGLATIIFSIIAALLQIPILRSQYKLVDLLQIPASVLFGFFLTSGGKLMNFFPDPTNFTFRFIIMLLSTAIVAIGVFFYVSARFVLLPPEGFLIAVSKVTKIKFSTLKVIGDVTMVAISLFTCLITIHAFGSIGMGTIVAAILVGIEVKVLNKYLGHVRDNLLGQNIA